MLWSYGGAGRWRGSRRSWFWFVGAVSGVQVLCIAMDYCCVATAAVELLVQRFAAADVAFLVQAALAALHHVNKVGQRLLLVHRDIPEVATHRLQRRRKRLKVKTQYTSTMFIYVYVHELFHGVQHPASHVIKFRCCFYNCVPKQYSRESAHAHCFLTFPTC